MHYVSKTQQPQTVLIDEPESACLALFGSSDAKELCLSDAEGCSDTIVSVVESVDSEVVAALREKGMDELANSLTTMMNHAAARQYIQCVKG
jgi:propanediol dehydratase large subunit